MKIRMMSLIGEDDEVDSVKNPILFGFVVVWWLIALPLVFPFWGIGKIATIIKK